MRNDRRFHRKLTTDNRQADYQWDSKVKDKQNGGSMGRVLNLTGVLVEYGSGGVTPVRVQACCTIPDNGRLLAQ